ncbi:MAG: inorganic diphosphatase [Legionellales bacterium]|nr:inorganic diphosphatase [Legionellales bacterium]
MGFSRIDAGREVPGDVNVIVEIAADSSPVKYEIDKNSDSIMVDRILSTAMHYPCNYGYVPQTLCDDGDPLDVLVLSPHPLLVGSVVRVRPIGVLSMTDESGGDDKMLAVPISKLTTIYDHIREPADLGKGILDMIGHFFSHYKDLEANKWAKVRDWGGSDLAAQVLQKSIEMYRLGSS